MARETMTVRSCEVHFCLTSKANADITTDPCVLSCHCSSLDFGSKHCMTNIMMTSLHEQRHKNDDHQYRRDHHPEQDTLRRPGFKQYQSSDQTQMRRAVFVVIAPIAAHILRLLRLGRMLARHHAIEELPDKTESVDAIVVFAGRERQQLASKVRIPAGVNGHVQSLQRHSAANRLRADSLVASRWEQFTVDICTALTLPPIDVRTNARPDLPGFLRPCYWIAIL